MPIRRSFRPPLTALLIAITAIVALVSPPISAASGCEWTGIDRIVAVGDVHGAYDRFVEILRTAGVIDAQGHWSAGSTHFVQLGDVVDRGADSRKALDLLRRLEGEATRAGGQVHTLLGNHEVMRMLGDLRFASPGESAAFATPGSVDLRNRFIRNETNLAEREELLKTPLGFVEMRMAFGREGAYGKWLRQLPAVIKINGFVFLHGGISSAFAEVGCAAINEQLRRELNVGLEQTRSAPAESLAVREDGPLWYRGLALEPDSFAPQVDDILSKLGARAIVIAHTITPTLRVTPRFGGKVIQIDTGMQPGYVPGGRASALEILRSTVTAIYVDRRDPVDAPAGQ